MTLENFPRQDSLEDYDEWYGVDIDMAPPSPRVKPLRLAVTLNELDQRRLQSLMSIYTLDNKSEAIRKSIGRAAFFASKEREGCEIFLKDIEGNIVQVLPEM